MSAFQSSVIYSVILAVVGFVLLSVIDITMSGNFIFAAGLLFGGLFIAVLNNSNNSPADNQAEPVATKTIYVGNLPYRANESVIKELFEQYGSVHSVRLLKDRQTGKRRGFGFVEMDEAAAAQAIGALNESEFQQRTLKVREAKERPEKIESGDFQEQKA